MNAIAQQLIDCGIVAIIRAPSGEMLADVAQALYDGGITAIEVTFTVPGAHRVLEEVRARLKDTVVLGAGTVLDPETARIAILSGAEFIVAPSLNLQVIEMAKRYAKAVVPGAFTPTEIVTAWQAGADIVKIFPADVGGPAFIKALRGPLPQVQMMATGGVNLDTAADFLRAGACCLGVGGSLVEKKALAEKNFRRITELASKYVEIVRQVRGVSAQ